MHLSTTHLAAHDVLCVLSPALEKITLIDAYIYLYCYHLKLCASALLHVHVIIYTVMVHSGGLYT